METSLLTRPVIVGATGSGRLAIIGWPRNAGAPVVITGDPAARQRCIAAALSQVARDEQACIIPVVTGPDRMAYAGALAATTEATRVMGQRLEAIDDEWGVDKDTWHPVVLVVDESQVCQAIDGITRADQARLHAQLLRLARCGSAVKVQVVLGITTLAATTLPADVRAKALVVDVHTVDADATRADVSFTLADRFERRAS